MKKWPEKTQHTEQHKRTRRTPRLQQTFKKKNKIFIVCFLFLLSFLFIFFLMISARNVELPPWYDQ